ncbi:MAG TPA: hypothetical protein PKL04_06815 [Methanofastidiosum sp.]|nr:hypothetical protein [Methanofastidiosum sp.]
MEYSEYKKISLKNNPEYNEKWVQDIIAENPSLLELGDIILKDKERIQPRAGRLDLLFQDAESTQRYEVELQLGATDESHIIRTIEYWDIERKRYPQYEHSAVIIAEDITSRFLNIISLFNGMIPIIALQMNAIQIGNKICLTFIKVVDQNTWGLVDDDEESEPTDRAYWEERSNPKILKMVDQFIELVKKIDEGYELKYNKFYIGITKNGKASNFFSLVPKKNFIQFNPRLTDSPETTNEIEEAGLTIISHSSRNRSYKIKMFPGDVQKHQELLLKLMNKAHEEYGAI